MTVTEDGEKPRLSPSSSAAWTGGASTKAAAAARLLASEARRLVDAACHRRDVAVAAGSGLWFRVR